MSVFSKLIAWSIPFIPKVVVGYFSRPYIAGETLEDGIRVVRELNARGIMATMDVLGESVDSREETLRMRRECEDVLHAIKKNNLDANLSIKPTQMGLAIDPSFFEENARVLLDIARGYDNFVRLDMEDHPYTDLTLEMYERLRRDYGRHVGVVLQSYLRRTEDDLRTLIAGGETNIRLCKGIYVEPERIAYKDRKEVRESFRRSVELSLSSGVYIGIATHDDVLLEHAVEYVSAKDIKREEYEFQMLLGVRHQRRDELVAMGHRLRVYVPFGDQWYPYSTRRLKENPSMAMHVIKAILGMGK
ncbi:MAG: proline dehydrogenase family protein [Bacteroidetes bacterium]|nr:proline dehydrogenase family protein [Bacteroidota bacterium]